jgi:hypothetical protein
LFQIGLKTAALARNIPAAIQGAQAEGYSILTGVLAGGLANGGIANYADQVVNDPNYSGIVTQGTAAVNLFKQYSSRRFGAGSTNATQND